LVIFYEACRAGRLFELAWVNRDGKPAAAPRSESFQRGGDPAISPDDRRVVMERQTGDAMQIGLYETSRGIMTRLTLDPRFAWFPVWSPDGKQVPTPRRSTMIRR
jgi:Tol biopolymer transport system component